MKKRKCISMIFTLSSLCSCSRILLPCCPLANFAQSTVPRTSGPVVVTPPQDLSSMDPANMDVMKGLRETPARAKLQRRMCSRVAGGLHR